MRLTVIESEYASVLAISAASYRALDEPEEERKRSIESVVARLVDPESLQQPGVWSHRIYVPESVAEGTLVDAVGLFVGGPEIPYGWDRDLKFGVYGGTLFVAAHKASPPNWGSSSGYVVHSRPAPNAWFVRRLPERSHGGG
jgi:hypothetical protein